MSSPPPKEGHSTQGLVLEFAIRLHSMTGDHTNLPATELQKVCGHSEMGGRKPGDGI